MVKDVTAPRKKYALVKWVRTWNTAHPKNKVKSVDGFNPDTETIGDAAREYLKNAQRAARKPVTGSFNRPTMLWLLPPTKDPIRHKVMSIVHGELGVHEWPPSSNRGEVLRYLRSAGINYGAPWCASFVTWCLHEAGFTQFPDGPASADSWGRWGKATGILKPLNKSLPGDLWGYEWGNSDGMFDHIGFCDDKNPKDNVAYGLDGNIGAYGGSVAHVVRSTSPIGYVIDLEKLYKLR